MQKFKNITDEFDPCTLRSCDGCGNDNRHINISEIFIYKATLEEKMANENLDYCDECYPFYARPEEQKNKCVECRKLNDVECNEKYLDRCWDIIKEDSNIHPDCLNGNLGKEKRRCTPNPFSKGIGCSVCGNLKSND